MSRTTALEVSIRKGTIALKDGKSLAEVLRTLVDDEPVESAQPFPDVPRRQTLTDQVKVALKGLPSFFGSVQPTVRRALKPAEVSNLYDEDTLLKIIETAAKKRRDSIKEAIRNHLDVTAEDDGLADPYSSPRDAHGHYVLGAPEKPETVAIPESDHVWAREYRTPKITAELLEKLVVEDKITRETYLAFTSPTRVLDEDKVFKAVHKDPSLLEALAEAAHAARPGSALNIR
jgi:hypothetical protein